MEDEWRIARVQLRELLHTHPEWSIRRMARVLGRTPSWVHKWKQRLQADPEAIQSQSRRRKTSPRRIAEAVVETILWLRDTLTERYHRRVGARNIAYHLQHSPDLRRQGYYLPTSSSTIHRILREAFRIPRPVKHEHHPWEVTPPMQVWEIDFTDVASASSAQTDKQQHQVETLNIVDTGTSMSIESYVRDNFDAEQALLCVVDLFDRVGLPRTLRFDRDPRWVASWTSDGYPSAFMRFLHAVGVDPDVCPPQSPEHKPFVERFHRTQQEECFQAHRPADVHSAQSQAQAYRVFYNLERPNQARSCQNRPPALAHPIVPMLPRLPAVVNPDAWLSAYDGQLFRRVVSYNGSVDVDKHSYYIGRHLRGQRVILRLEATQEQFECLLQGQVIKRLPIKGLYHGTLPFADYVELICQEARSEARRLRQHRKLRAQTRSA